jgi:hypothetical protein
VIIADYVPFVGTASLLSTNKPILETSSRDTDPQRASTTTFRHPDSFALHFRSTIVKHIHTSLRRRLHIYPRVDLLTSPPTLSSSIVNVTRYRSPWTSKENAHPPTPKTTRSISPRFLPTNLPLHQQILLRYTCPHCSHSDFPNHNRPSRTLNSSPRLKSAGQNGRMARCQ